MIRLRQVALVARDLETAVGELCSRLGLTVCFHDPGVAAFGLHNALMTIGDQFLEVVAPTQPGTTAGR
ncbi:MAG: VOC family protein, partial [Sphingomonadales bacterium]